MGICLSLLACLILKEVKELKSVSQISQHRVLSRETVAVAKNLFEEFDGAIIEESDRHVYDNFVKAYKEFLDYMAQKDVNTVKIRELYCNLNDNVLCMLQHYPYASMVCRKYSLARLTFVCLSRRYHNLSQRGGYAILCNPAFIKLKEAFEDMETLVLSGVIPDSNKTKELEDMIKICEDAI